MTPGPQLPAPSRLIETEIGNPPADRTPVSRQGLPEDLLQEAAHRLGVVCLVSGGLWLANFIAVHLIHPMPGTLRAEQLALHPQWMRVFDVVGGAGFLASLGLFWYTRRTTRGPRFLLDLALCYEVFIALNIGILDYAVGYPAGVSWIAIIILLFPPGHTQHAAQDPDRGSHRGVEEAVGASGHRARAVRPAGPVRGRAVDSGGCAAVVGDSARAGDSRDVQRLMGPCLRTHTRVVCCTTLGGQRNWVEPRRLSVRGGELPLACLLGAGSRDEDQSSAYRRTAVPPTE
jgi:hypothetical protein